MMINFFHYLLIGEMLLIIIFMIYEVIKVQFGGKT